MSIKTEQLFKIFEARHGISSDDLKTTLSLKEYVENTSEVVGDIVSCLGAMEDTFGDLEIKVSDIPKLLSVLVTCQMTLLFDKLETYDDDDVAGLLFQIFIRDKGKNKKEDESFIKA